MYEFIELDFERLPADEQRRRMEEFHERLKRRRTVRHFSSEPVDEALIENAILVAGTAPSGANQQPWRFVVVSDPDVKGTYQFTLTRSRLPYL